MLLHGTLFAGSSKSVGLLGGAKISGISLSKLFVKSTSTSFRFLLFGLLVIEVDSAFVAGLSSEPTRQTLDW